MRKLETKLNKLHDSEKQQRRDDGLHKENLLLPIQLSDLVTEVKMVKNKVRKIFLSMVTYNKYRHFQFRCGN